MSEISIRETQGIYTDGNARAGSSVYRLMNNQSRNPRIRSKRNLLLPIILLVLSIVAACNLTSGLFSSAVSYPGILVTADPLATATATPFAPIQPTQISNVNSTQIPTLLPSAMYPYAWGPFNAPAEPSAIEIPPPVASIPQSENAVNIILLGSDQRPKDGGFRTDTMVILMLDPDNKTATMFSLPRDLYIYIPGWRVDRINTADIRGGAEWVFDAVEYNFGIQLDYWARANFNGFTTAIDTLGGIQVHVSNYVYDRCGDINYEYYPGSYQMDGFTALCYVRMRKRTSDFDRLRRQQEVVQAIFERVLRLDGLSRVPDFYNQFNYLVQTNLTLEDILPLVPLGTSLASDTSKIHRFTIGPDLVTHFRVPYSGAAVLLPDREAIQAALLDTMNP
jgi:polyisoprenyl-teichoic acid--peptidoglycan teichoic acid transferase